MSLLPVHRLRVADLADLPVLLDLWGSLFEDETGEEPWRVSARAWFASTVDDGATARLPVVEVGGVVVATAIGTLELGVPNPYCPRGRTVRLANVVTRPGHRGHGYGTLLVDDVIAWARRIEADRVDLSATPEGRRLYEKAGFALTRAPRMKLSL
ncbi:GNAT family N-acetyltransferase [Luteipulveratus sp. YIM 133132]|uniref:GNAT family N-acetyltransferase n=1 Tax=Luteipulveratus flavus TaxID=3031728 RepID=A0ABT6CG14_9MICO|nr:MULTISPECIES: GNAT family N-acetyltransferase [unclassified Luteipulveratus]MDE9367388.1 GNAT family N-acetyltransferase [Luteipulveratus sp. YIM 133132]MDF8266231.1 GNAT family N-acetyltransferase [Luteipulveratus sp. YIM 133296]